MTVKENLIAAKALINTPEKWGKGASDEREPRFCALGAANIAATGNVYSIDEYVERELEEAIPPSFERHVRALRLVPDFNDHPDTTHADIMALFDRAIEACDD